MSEDLSIREIRLEKLSRLRELGFDPFAVERFDNPFMVSDIFADWDNLAPELNPDGHVDPSSASKKTISFAGRIVSVREMGKAAFVHLSDGDDKIQCYIRKNDLDEFNENAWEAFKNLDIGDHLGVTGYLFITKTGEKSIYVKTFHPLSKSLHVLPLGKEKDGEQWYGLSDVEQRYRHRHLDLITNRSARQQILNRSKIVTAVRHFFDSRGYFEVETPLLQLEAGGAAARPFLTHYNAYELDVKLRISLELYLKRIICGDVRKVYEIGRVFRNEGVSNRHNPEFTLLEWYEAYANLEDMMTIVEDLFRYVSIEVFGTTVVGEIDFGRPWARLDLLDAIGQASEISRDELRELNSARAAMKRVGLPTENENNLGGIIEKLLEHFVEPNLQQPTFITGYPIETSPLAKKDPNRPGITRRFEGYVLGREICNAFSEINDPIDQRERFEQQLEERASGDDEAHPMDEEFLYALESGMPPTGGCGIGIDRLVMLLTGADHLREILLFPMMRPEA
ncbi:lysine--tRNA ligase [Kamptonema cortianum]|nr:lysine--tRNA ligase [Geitlerinema splendidum]MDK3156348.1 lysine--tRNA ligase [Kamptonema cortianum]